MFEGVNLGLLVAMVITGVAVIVLMIFGFLNFCRKNDTKIVDKKTYVFETESSEYEDSKSSSIEIFEKEKPLDVKPKDAEKCLDVLKNKKVIPIRLTEDIVKKFNNLQNSDVTNHTGFLSQSTYSDMQDRVVPRKPTP